MERARVEIGAKRGTLMRARSAPEAARLEARRQIGYFAMIVPPARADAPMRPRRAANTALAFVVVFGIHLFASLTVSVLREQFSA
jgi:capsular polysaccharide transport system permease protein